MVGIDVQAAHWAVGAGNKFREVMRTTENPTTKALAEGLYALSEAIRALTPQDLQARGDCAPQHPEPPPF